MAGILALTGGGLVGASCFLPWLSLSISFAGLTGSANLQGTDTTAGKVALLLAFAAVLAAALDVRAGEQRLRRPAAAAALVGAAIVVYKSWSLTSQVNGTGLAHVSTGIGMWAALLGGGLALASDFVGRG
jgi:hypothetical protein